MSPLIEVSIKEEDKFIVCVCVCVHARMCALVGDMCLGTGDVGEDD